MTKSKRHILKGAGRSLLAMGMVAVLAASMTSQASAATFPGPVFTEHQDIGAVGIAGNATYAAGTQTYTMTASGADIWEAADQFHYLYTQLSGNVRVSATLKWVNQADINANVSTWAKLGIMFRESVNADSKHVFVAFPSGNTAQMQYRPTTAAASVNRGGYTVTGDTVRLRATRMGSGFTMEVWEGGAWVAFDSISQDMPNDMLWGIACTSHNNAASVVGEVSNLLVEVIPGGVNRVPGAYTYGPGRPIDVVLNVDLDYPATGTVVSDTVPNGWTISNITGGGTVAGRTITWNLGDLAASTQVSYTVTPNALAGDQAFTGAFTMSGLNFPVSGVSVISADPVTQVYNGPQFTHQLDIGTLCVPGVAGYDTATATWTNSASGSDIWGTTDHFHYAFAETEEENFRISGKLIFPLLGIPDMGMPADPWAKTGLMVRDNLSGGSANVMALLSADNGARLQQRAMQGGASESIDFGWKPFDWDADDPLFQEVGIGYVRLTKTGTQFVMEYKNEPADPWTYGATYNVDLGSGPFYWGHALTSHTPMAPDACDPFFDWTFGDVQELLFEAVYGSSSREIDSMSYMPETPIGISVSVDLINDEPQTVVIRETVPAGWAVTDISNGGTFAGNTVTWNLGSVGDSTVSYTLTPPASVAGSTDNAVITGTSTLGGTVMITGGDNTLGPPAGVIIVPNTPASAPVMDGVINEAVEYPDAAYFEYDTQNSAEKPGWYQADGTAATYPGDFAGKVWMQYDDEYLWVAYRVTDDVVQPAGPSADTWRRDSSEMYLDANLSRSNPKENGVNGFQATVQADGSAFGGNDITGTGDGTYWSARASVKDTHTWEVEYRISLAATDLQPGDMAGFDITINDCDDTTPTDVRAGKHWWWTSGSDSWNDETPWGLIVLEGGTVVEPPVITAITKAASGVQITWTSQAGVSYGIMAKDTLDGTWTEIAAVDGADGTTSYVDTAATQGAKFYSVVVK